MVPSKCFESRPDPTASFSSQAGLRSGHTWADLLTWETSIDAMTNALRWAGFLLPEDRVEKGLWGGKIKPSDMATPDRLKVLVEFRSEVRTNEVQRILAKHASAYSPFGMTGEWIVEIPVNHVKVLAAENSIWWIRSGSSGFLPLAVPAKKE
jgi:hypothetical protein